MIKEIVRMTVEASKTGFSVYSDDFPVHGYGKTVDEAKADLEDAFAEMVALYKETGLASHPSFKTGKVTFVYDYDLKSIFDHFGIEAKSLANKIGMNDSLLRQYINGLTKPSEKQKNRIQQGLHQLGKELLTLQLQ